LFAEALCFEDHCFDVAYLLFGLFAFVVVLFDLFCLGEGVDGVVVVALGHEGLGEGDLHVDLEELGFGQFVD
jgi:hypothetical protein